MIIIVILQRNGGSNNSNNLPEVTQLVDLTFKALIKGQMWTC